MPKRRYNRKYKRDKNGRFAKSETKAQALSRHRAVLKTSNTYKRPSPNPAFGAKVIADLDLEGATSA